MTEEDHIIQRMSKEISIRDHRINELIDEVFHLKIAIDSRDIEIKDIKKELRKRWERIEELNKENSSLAGTVFELGRKLELHERFHGKVGCPGGDKCYVCKEDYK